MRIVPSSPALTMRRPSGDTAMVRSDRGLTVSLSVSTGCSSPPIAPGTRVLPGRQAAHITRLGEPPDTEFEGFAIPKGAAVARGGLCDGTSGTDLGLAGGIATGEA